ncbi:hypothetical protein M8C21_025636 [Ambrosia artemisiifolia]|uniref:BAR domain-containing protein n=1 Tax=Ambrosia artemisiifolia TaxID=4212 RepID=A0AAD5G665_AMBAR|nr:hypothetical protein M8C21_025636 [Ambrosia artemisiifolia]
MKSSLNKLGRKLSMSRSDVKDKKDHQPSAHLEELAQASKDMQDMRNCYDSLLAAAAATANSIYEFAESLNEMGTCLLDKTTMDADDESGRVLSALGNMQAELQKIADTYRSYVIVTVTNPTESLLSELRKVEEMKLQCDEKREAYEYMMAQHKDKGKLKSGKIESSTMQKLQEAQDEYNEVARLCAFRVKSLKEGQCRSLLAQAARHHAAQLNFFRKGVKVLEEVDPHVRSVAEKHRIDCQLSDGVAGEEGEGISSYESTDDGELSFDYRQKKQGLATSSNPMELDRVDTAYPQNPNSADSDVNVNKYQREQSLGRQRRVSSYSAPLYPEKIDPSGKPPKETQPGRKFHSYVLPPPVDTKTSNSRTPPTSGFQYPLPDEKHEKDTGNDNTSTSASASKPTRSTENATSSTTQLPAPSTERFSFPQHHSTAYDGKTAAKRQAYSGPLTPSKSFSGKMMSSSGGQNVSSRSVSPPNLSSPKISELHELPRPPPPGSTSLTFSKPSGLIGHNTPPLFFKNQEASSQPSNKRPVLTSTVASPLPVPPLVVSRSFSIPSTNQRAISSLHVPDLKVSPHTGQAPSPPLTPVSLANVSTVSDVAAHMAHI